MISVVDTLGNGTATNGCQCALVITANEIVGADGACYDRGCTFRRKWFPNGMAPYRKIVGNNNPFLFRMALVVYLEAMGILIRYSSSFCFLLQISFWEGT